MDERKALIGSRWAKATRIVQRGRAFDRALVGGRVGTAICWMINEDEDIRCIGRANQEAITISPPASGVMTAWSPWRTTSWVGARQQGSQWTDPDRAVNVVGVPLVVAIED